METDKEAVRYLRSRQTKVESAFWLMVRNRGFKGLRFRRQYPVNVEEFGVTRVYIADFYCHEYLLIVELDGPVHESRSESDMIRDTLLAKNGFSVMRFQNEVVTGDPQSVLHRIGRFIENIDSGDIR